MARGTNSSWFLDLMAWAKQPQTPILCGGRRDMGSERFIFTPREVPGGPRRAALSGHGSSDTQPAGVARGTKSSWFHSLTARVVCHHHPFCARGADIWAVNAYSHLVRCLVDRIEQLYGRETAQGFAHCDLLRGPTLGKVVTTYQLGTCRRTRPEMIKCRHMRPFTVWGGGG